MATAQLQSSVHPRELHRRLAAAGSADLLDVRTPGEFAAAHAPGARLAPLDELDATAILGQRGGNDKPLYVLCHSGGRARKAIEKFQRAGFDGCVLVEGGTQAWIEAGLPVVRGKGKVLPLMRQVQIAVGFASAAGAVLALAVNPWFSLVPLVTGSGLLFAGVTGFCGLGRLLAKLPWNRAAGLAADSSCEVKP